MRNWENMGQSAAAKSLQSCPTLCNPIDGSPLGSPVPGILQARILERVAMPSSREVNYTPIKKAISFCPRVYPME